jgi:hypothetical protein
MALGECFTRSAVACEFSFLPVWRMARGDAFCDPRRVLAIAGRPSVRRDRRAKASIKMDAIAPLPARLS